MPVDDSDVVVIEVSEGPLQNLIQAGGYTIAHPDFPDTKLVFVAGQKRVQVWVAGALVAEWTA